MYKSVLIGDGCIIIKLPYDVALDNFDDRFFADHIYEGIVAIWYYVHEKTKKMTSEYVYESVYVPKYMSEPMTVSRYPSKTYMMYSDMLSYINQYMRVQLNFSDFIGISEDSITGGLYYSDKYFAYVIDLEFPGESDESDDI